MQLTYNQALGSIIENTEIGYTIASQDRLWICFTFDVWSEDEFKHNRIYPMVADKPGIVGSTAYDRDIEAGGSAVPVWTTRAEAEDFAEQWRNQIDAWMAEPYVGAPPSVPREKPVVYVMNLGDDARFEANIIGRYGVTVRDKPKFAGSRDAWHALAEQGVLAMAHYSTLEAERTADEEPSCP